MAKLRGMADFSNTGDSLDLRASDTDRERVADRLRDAAAQGQITMDELDERLETTYAAKTFGQLVPVTADLPAAAPRSDAVAVSAGRALVGGTPTRRRWSVAILSGSSHKGFWTAPSRYKALALLGGVEIDLREATFAEPVTVIHAFAVLGGIEIKVPEGVEVHVDAFGIMGGVDNSAASGNPMTSGTPVVRVAGFAFMGGIDVSRKPLKKKKSGKLPDGDRGEIEQ
jgi:hypothetical protein